MITTKSLVIAALLSTFAAVSFAQAPTPPAHEATQRHQHKHHHHHKHHGHQGVKASHTR